MNLKKRVKLSLVLQYSTIFAFKLAIQILVVILILLTTFTFLIWITLLLTYNYCSTFFVICDLIIYYKRYFFS